MAIKNSWKEDAWEKFLVKFWDNKSSKANFIEYSKDDLGPFLSKYKKSGQGEIRIFHYGSEKVMALKKRNITKIPISRQRWQLVKAVGKIEFKEPQEEIIFQTKNKLTDGMVVGIKSTMEQSTNPGETTLLAIANYSGIIADFYKLGKPGILFTGGRQRAGIHLVVRGHDVDMSKAQIEIDGGFEWTDTVVIVEMKSSFNQKNFDINQALIPMLKWRTLLKHKLVYSLVMFAQTNKIGIEYWAYDLKCNNKSIGIGMKIVKSKKYILEIK